MDHSLRATDALSALAEAIQDEGWQTMPHSLLTALRATYAVLQIQQEQLEKKVEREELKKAFRLKANTVDVEESMDRVGEALESKVGIEDLEEVLVDYITRKELAPLGLVGGKEGTSGLGGLENRVGKLEQMALSLDAEESQAGVKGYLTKAEGELLERGLAECVKVDELREFGERVATLDGIEELVAVTAEREVAKRTHAIDRDNKEQFRRLADELEGRLDLDEFGAIRRDLERLAKGMGQEAPVARSVQEGLHNLQNRMAVVEPVTNVVAQLHSDFQQLSSIQKDIQSQLNKMAQELLTFPVSARLEEVDSHLTSSIKALDSRTKRLEKSDQRTQEVLEILSKSRLVDKDKETESG